MEIVLGERFPFFGKDRRLVAHHIHVFGKLKTMFGHRRRQVSFVRGGEIDGAEREGHDIVLNRDGRGCLILE